MARSKEYQRLLNDKRWKALRAAYLREHPLCEQCLIDGGYIRAAVDVHHKLPVEASTYAEMERRCYDWNNLMALCVPCHVKIHQAMGKSTKANHQQREKERLARWMERHTRRPADNEGCKGDT